MVHVTCMYFDCVRKKRAFMGNKEHVEHIMQTNAMIQTQVPLAVM